MTPVLGVDSCPGGWLAALVDGADVRWLLTAEARVLLAVPAAAVAVDMPIGLPDAGPRLADRLARQLLGDRGCCVFPAPPRAVLPAVDYPDACRRCRTVHGRALSRQTYHLLDRIRDLDRQLRPADSRRVVEAHPELSFTRMAGRPLPSKHHQAGRRARLTALRRWLPQVGEAVRAAPRPAGVEDALDALACAWTAARWSAGAAESLPDRPPRDRRGLPMRIVS